MRTDSETCRDMRFLFPTKNKTCLVAILFPHESGNPGLQSLAILINSLHPNNANPFMHSPITLIKESILSFIYFLSIIVWIKLNRIELQNLFDVSNHVKLKTIHFFHINSKLPIRLEPWIAHICYHYYISRV